jgi:tetratricopeptide (TPR) repeat protein
MADGRRELALDLYQKAHKLQRQGDADLAVDLCRRSLQIYPTPEAHTLLGWAYHAQGRLDDAIAECKKAVALDPDYGNPYNDIGAYLIEKGDHDGAIEWLDQATRSRRYQSYHHPWYNLGRAYAAKELFNKASQCFEHALEIEPDYTEAESALRRVKLLVQ